MSYSMYYVIQPKSFDTGAWYCQTGDIRTHDLYCSLNRLRNKVDVSKQHADLALSGHFLSEAVHFCTSQYISHENHKNMFVYYPVWMLYVDNTTGYWKNIQQCIWPLTIGDVLEF